LASERQGVPMQANGDPPILATLVFPRQGSRIMLATKMRGIGVGYLNGWGGGVESGESIFDAMLREFREEAGGAEITDSIVASGVVRCHGVVHFRNFREDGTYIDCDVYVYFTPFWSGQIQSSEEMRSPGWHGIHNLPYLNLMPGDKFWLPRFARLEPGEALEAWVVYGPEQRELLDDVLVRPWPGEKDPSGAY
jgi:8-oxo-dGTP diphosphatase